MKLKLDEFTQYKFLSHPTYSPNGAHVCFVVHAADVEENTYQSHLWIYQPADDTYWQLTAADNEAAYIWLQDSDHILFPGARTAKDKEKLKDGEEFTVFHSISIRGGEAREAFRIPFKVNQIKQLDGNTYLFSTTFNPNKSALHTLTPAEKTEELKRRQGEKDYEVLEEIPYWGNGDGFTSGNRNRLYLFHSDTKTFEALTDENLDVDSFELSPEYDKVVIVGREFTGKMEVANSLYLLTLKDKSLNLIGPSEPFRYGFAGFLQQDTVIFSGSDMKAYGTNENAKFYLIDLGSGATTCLTPDFVTSTWNSVGSDCRYGGSPAMKVRNGYLYFITTELDSSYVNRIDSKGYVEKITTQSGSVDGYDVSGEELVMVAMRGLKLQELYRLVGTQETQMTQLNAWVQGRALAELEKLSVETAPGAQIDGWVMKPVDFEPTGQYPAILNIHGGPKTVYGEIFVHEMQYWANHGYFVFFCNPRGSDGKDNEFADIRGKYGTIDYDDLMQFTDAVLAKYPSIDQTRVGVTGGSYGGFMTNWIIGHTDRFRAAASQRSISNWISKFCTTDIGYYFVNDQIAGTPWGDPDKLWEQSPLKYADRAKTPTLFIHSDEDYRCWLAEGLQMFTALKFHGVEARMCMFRGENHELSRSGKPKHRIRRLQEITNWFDHHLKGSEDR